MGTYLSIAGKHTFSEEFTKEKIVSLAYRIADSFMEKFKLEEKENDANNDDDDEKAIDNFEIYLDKNFQNPSIKFYVNSIGNGIGLFVYKDAFLIDSYYKFSSFVYDAKAGTDKDAGFFKDFRKDIFDMIQLMNCHRVIYLCGGGSGREQETYVDKLMNGVYFQEVEQQLIKRYGEPITDLNKINRDGDPYTFYDRLNEFVVDDFKDFIKDER